MATEAPPAPPPPAPSPSAPPTPPAPPTTAPPAAPASDKGPAQPAPKKGSVMDQVLGDLRKKVKPQFFESAPDSPPEQPTPAAGPHPAPGDSPPKAAGDPSSTPAAPAPEEKKSKNPWKLVDEYKARAIKLESELVETRKAGFSPEERKSIDQQVADLRKANEDLEKEIRFVNYAKSNEFKTKYKEPYEKAWERAAKEVSEIIIQDQDTGERRSATTSDLYKVVVSPLNEARDLADAVFGKFADDVMQYRKEIRSLNDAQEAALKQAHDASIERDKQLQAQNQNFLNTTAAEIKKNWDAANQEFADRPDLAYIFKPADTDEEHKTRLAKGFELVDKAFATNSADPRLTSEQRAEAVKLHAAVRMRAAGFGPLRAQRDSLQKKVAALEKELAQYKETVPPAGGTSGPDTTPAKPSSGWDNIRAGLQKIAKPA